MAFERAQRQVRLGLHHGEPLSGGMYVEQHQEIGTAIAREKLVKKWRRE